MARPRKKPSVKQSANVAHKEYLTFDPNRGSHSIDELATIRKALAKRANQRLVRLEREKSKVTGKAFEVFGAREFAYEYLERQKHGKRRYTESKRKDETFDDIRNDILQIQSFLIAKTSRVAGVHEIENLRMSKFEGGEWGERYRRAKEAGITGAELEKYKMRGLKFSGTKEFYDFLNSSTFAGLKASGFTSEQLIELYDAAIEKETNADEKVMAKLEEALEAYQSGEEASFKDLQERLGLKKPTGKGRKKKDESRRSTKGRRRKG